MPNLIIDNFFVSSWLYDIRSDEAVVFLEHVVGVPCDLLCRKHGLKNRTEWLMFILPHIAKMFSIDRKELLKQYVHNNYGAVIC